MPPALLAEFRTTIDRFLIGRRDLPASEITSADVQEFLTCNGWRAATARSFLIDLRTLFAWGVRNKLCRDNPALAVELPRLEEAPPGIVTPAPKPAPKQERSALDPLWNDGWFTEEEAKPATPAPALRTAQAPVQPRPAAATVKVRIAPQPQLASPRPAIPAAPAASPKVAIADSQKPAPQVAVMPRSPETPAASQVPTVTHQATPAPVVAVPVPETVKPAPGTFQLFAPTVKREDLAAIFANGKRLARKDAVTALKARGVKQTTAYNALRDGGRFADLLTVGEDGLLAFKG